MKKVATLRAGHDQGGKMQAYIYWFILAFVFVAVEMLTGTFYFLAVSIAAAAGGLLALARLGPELQYALSGVIAVAGVMVVRYMRKSQRAHPDLSLDVGQPVKVLIWNADGTARVFYRGAEWDAELEAAGMAHEGPLYIKAIQGSRLIVTQHRPR
jgi:membrane protein implicated in regulation of membrane protease activity